MAHTKVTKTYSQNTGAANTFSYSGSFDVFKGTEVECELDNVQLTFTASTINESASPREYTVDTSAKTIHIGGADLSSGTIIIRPVTDMGAPTPRADYAPGSSITSADLNNNQLQLMRKAMEYDEQKLSSLGGTMTGHLTMGEDQTIIFEGATDDAYETTLTVADPTADRTITLPNVTGTVVTTGDTATVTATMLADDSVDSSELVDGSIDTSHISSGAITTAKLAADVVTGAKIADDAIDSEHYVAGSIDTAHIGDGQVTHVKLAGDAVDGDNIADDSIDSEHYVAASIDTEHIKDAQVTTDKIPDQAITGAKIKDNNVGTTQLGLGCVTTVKISDANVTTAKIATDAITGAKIADDAVDSEHYTDGSIDTAHIADLNVTTAKIAADAVTGAKLADDAVDSEHYTDASIDTAHIADGQVTAVKVASNAVTTAKITDANVTTVKVADSNITLAKLASDLKQTSISDDDTQLPTSGAVVDYVAAQLLPFGGFEAIATEVAFPNTQPASGVIISISDAAGVVVNGSGTSTTGRTVGSSTVTINNFPSSLNGETLASGVGLMVSSTGSSQIYNYHKILAAETDVKQLSDDINDFQARYRVHAGEPSSNNDEGDLVYDTTANKMKVYDGSSWGEVTSTGDFKYLVMTNAGTTNAATLNGSTVTFDLKETSTSGSAASVTSAAQLLVSVNGVVQKANTGTSASGLDGFVMADSDTITFCAAPASGDDIFIVQFGSALTVNTPGAGTVVEASLGSGAVTTAKIADANVTTAKLASDAVTGAKIADDAINSEHYTDGSIDTAHIADDQVTTAKIADDAVTADKLANAINTDIAAKAVLTGSTNNTVATVTGANALAGEANLTFEGGATGDALLSIHAEEAASDAEAILKLETSHDFAESVVQAYDSSGVGGSLKYNHGDNAWRFTTNGDVEKARIDSDGLLTVKRSETNATSSNWLGSAVSIQNTHDTDNNASCIWFQNSAGGIDSAIQGIHQDAAGTSGARRGHIQFGTSDANTSGSVVERMRIRSNGNVNLGTAPADPGSAAGHFNISCTASSQMLMVNSDVSASGYTEMSFAPSNQIVGSSIKCQAAEDFSDYASRTAYLQFQARKDGNFNTRLEVRQDALWVTTAFLPGYSNTLDMGNSTYYWDDVYANGTINFSDRNGKNTIADTDLGLSFVNKLKPVSYKFNDGESGRTHYGLISQDVETLLSDISKSTTDFAGFIKTDVPDTVYEHRDFPDNIPDGKKVGDVKTPAHTNYGLRYTEFIAPLIKAVQELSTEVETLKTKVAALEAK